jgi:NAD(P)-dependent dehydrogenase (short-subunit alcohol dehydrogenase family)
LTTAGIVSTFADEFDLWEETITTNLTSVMYLSKLVLPHLEESVKKHGHASLIVNSSIMGFLKSGSIPPCTSLCPPLV